MAESHSDHSVRAIIRLDYGEALPLTLPLLPRVGDTLQFPIGPKNERVRYAVEQVVWDFTEAIADPTIYIYANKSPGYERAA